MARIGTIREPVPMPGIAREDREGAKRMALIAVEGHCAGAYVPPGTGKTVSEWFVKWTESRAAKGKRTRDDFGRYTKWIEPRIGTKPIASVTKRDLEIFAIATYLYCREGELAALDWPAVNLAQGLVSFHQSEMGDDEIKAEDRPQPEDSDRTDLAPPADLDARSREGRGACDHQHAT